MRHKKSRTRFTLDLSPELYELLERLEVAYDAPSKTELIRLALRHLAAVQSLPQGIKDAISIHTLSLTRKDR